jgi:hypothetical protein
MEIQNIIKEIDGKFYVYSHDGKKKLGGPYDTKAEAEERLGVIEYFKKHPKNMFCNVTVQLKTNLIKNDSLDGKSYKVVPMVMLVEGVHNGSVGPYLYTEEAISARPEIWNMKPVVVFHPENSITACTKEIVESRGIGIIMNSHYDNGLKAEAWIDPDKLKKVDKKVGNKIGKAMEKGEMLELSTGLFADSDETPGEWGDKKEKFNGTLTNLAADHLAVLPNQKGACSIEDGAGFIRNSDGEQIEVSKSWSQYFENLGVNALRQQLVSLIAKDKEYRWVDDIDPDTQTFIWSDEKTIYRQGYKVNADVATLDGVPEEVVRVVSYKAKSKIAKNERTENMNKKAKVDALIANEATQWEETDRDYLMGLEDKVLDKMVPKVTKNEESEKTEVKTENQDTKKDEKPLTDEEYIAALPPRMQATVRNMQKREDDLRKKLIAKITANKRAKFSEAFLSRMSLEDLEGMAALAAPVQNEDDGEHLFADYGGQGDPVEIDNEGGNGELPVLQRPVMNFGKAKETKEKVA